MSDIPLFPVADWTCGPVPAYGLITLRLGFLSHQLQRPDEADPGRYYALTAPQTRELIAALAAALQKLETAEPQAAPGPRH